jgi:integrase
MSIYRDPERGQFIFEFDRTIEGQRVRVRKRLPKTWNRTEADAFDRQESDRLYKVATGVKRDRPLIESAVDVYLKDKKHLKSFKATSEHLAASFWAYKGKYMDELPDVAQEMRDKWEDVMAPATIRNRIACVRAACRWAWKKHNMGDGDPGARVIEPTVRNQRHVYIDVEQLHKIIRHCRHPEARAAAIMAFYTGMRLGELMRARVEGGALVVYDTKNGAAVKAVPLHERAERYAGMWPLTCSKKTIQAWHQYSRDRAGLPHVHFHDLRHSTASAMINQGVDLYTVGAILGHKDLRSTQRYAHLQQQKLAAAISKIGGKKAA